MLFLAAMKCGYQEDPPLIKNYGLRIIYSLRQDTSRRLPLQTAQLRESFQDAIKGHSTTHLRCPDLM